MMLKTRLLTAAAAIAIAAGAWLGGAMIDGGLGYASLPWTGVIGSALAVAVALASWSRARKS